MTRAERIMATVIKKNCALNEKNCTDETCAMHALCDEVFPKRTPSMVQIRELVETFDEMNV